MLTVFRYNLALARASISTTKIDPKLRRMFFLHGKKHGLNPQEMALLFIDKNPGSIEDLDGATKVISEWRSTGKIRESKLNDAKTALIFESIT